MKEFKTLEEAKAEIIRLNEENTRLTNERDTFSQNNTNLTAELENVRKLNQQYFNKLSAQYSQDEKEDQPGEDDQPQSCEEFARTLTII